MTYKATYREHYTLPMWHCRHSILPTVKLTPSANWHQGSKDNVSQKMENRRTWGKYVHRKWGTKIDEDEKYISTLSVRLSQCNRLVFKSSGPNKESANDDTHWLIFQRNLAAVQCTFPLFQLVQFWRILWHVHQTIPRQTTVIRCHRKTVFHLNVSWDGNCSIFRRCYWVG